MAAAVMGGDAIVDRAREAGSDTDARTRAQIEDHEDSGLLDAAAVGDNDAADGFEVACCRASQPRR